MGSGLGSGLPGSGFAGSGLAGSGLAGAGLGCGLVSGAAFSEKAAQRQASARRKIMAGGWLKPEIYGCGGEVARFWCHFIVIRDP